VINLRLLRNFPLTLGSTMGLIFGIGLAGTTFVLPQFTQDLLGYNALQSGLVLLPRAIGLFLLMPVAGWLYNYVDSRLMIFFGLAFMCWSYWDLSQLSLQADFWSMVPMLLIMGIGMPFMFVTLSTVSLSTVERHDMTSASSFYTLTRRVGGNIGYALVATVVADRIQVHRSILSRHLNPFSDVYRHVHDALSAALAHQGLTMMSAKHVATGLLNQMINRQATMMAYNDLSMLLGLMFVGIAPLILFFPRRRKIKPAELKEAGVDVGE
jgi:DHA2 family multidrug resistance protein